MAGTSTRLITAQRLTRDAYRPYGDVIAADDGLPFKPANFGRAKRFNYLADALNLRPETAQFNLCLFRCSAFTEPQLDIKMLERHPLSTQVFLPMHDGKYITVVARGADEPDLSTLAAFVVEGPQGISYYPGIWHYPMTALGKELDLACIVFEDGGKDDCLIHDLTQPITVRF